MFCLVNIDTEKKEKEKPIPGGVITATARKKSAQPSSEPLGLDKDGRILELVDLDAIKRRCRTLGDYGPEKCYRFAAFY